MTRPVEIRDTARRDVTEAGRYLTDQVDGGTGVDFVPDFEQAVTSLGTDPAIGAPWFASGLDLPGPRARGLALFPYLIHRFDDDHVEVWRDLHTRRDLPAPMQSDGDE